MANGDPLDEQRALATARSSDVTPVVVPGTTLPTGPSLTRGSLLGRYVVIDVLGAGGMGEVYTAIDPQLDRRVALKLVQSRFDKSSPGAVQAQSRLLREAQAMAKLSHPNVVSIYDVGEVDQQVFLAMELVDGRTVTDWALEKRRTWQEIVAVFKDAGRGLAAAHAVGIVHRDFKPDNILVGRDGRVRVLDFGLARASADQADPEPGEHTSSGSLLSVHMTHAATVLGTPGYMAPEQFNGTTADARSDQFAFCVALYKILYRQPPFPTDGPLSALQAAVTSGVITPPLGTSDVPGWVYAIVAKGLSVDPANRFASMDSLLHALDQDPAGARRGRLQLAVAIAALLALIGGTVFYVQHLNRRCTGAEARLTGIWDAPRRKAIADAFHATQLDLADEAWAGLEPVLTRYATEWVAQHTETCEATSVKGTQSEAVLTLRMACLNARLDELNALSSALVQADAKTVKRAARAPDGLTDLGRCADVVALERRLPLPKNLEAQQRIEAAQHTLREGTTLYSLGRFAEAFTVIDAVRAEADAIGYAPLQAEVRIWLFKTDGHLGKADQIHELALQAVTYAESSQDDTSRFEGILALAHLGYQRGNPIDEVLTYCRLAESILPRIKDNDRLRVNLGVVLGNIYITRQRTAEARAAYSAADEIASHSTQELGSVAAMAAENLAFVDITQHHFLKALAEYEKTLEASRKRLGRHHPDLGSALGNIAGIQMQLNRPKLAYEAAHEGWSVLAASAEPGNLFVAEALANEAETLTMLGRTDEAEAELKSVLAVREQEAPNGPSMANLLIQYGRNFLAQKRGAEALAMFKRALAMNEKLGAELVSSMVGQGLALQQLGSLAEAESVLVRALDLLEKDATPDFAVIAQTGLALAQVQSSLKRDPAAVRAMAKKALEASKQAEGDWADRTAMIEQWLAAH